MIAKDYIRKWFLTLCVISFAIIILKIFYESNQFKVNKMPTVKKNSHIFTEENLEVQKSDLEKSVLSEKSVSSIKNSKTPEKPLTNSIQCGYDVSIIVEINIFVLFLRYRNDLNSLKFLLTELPYWKIRIPKRTHRSS